MAHSPQSQHQPQTQHPSHSLDTDSPASASSSTLITPLPLNSDSLAHKVSLSSPDLIVTTRKRPSLSLSLGGGGRGGGRGGRGDPRESRGERGGRGENRPAGVTGAAPEGRMSGKGFIEPHRSHLPRRARTTVRRGTTTTAGAAGVGGEGEGGRGAGQRVTSTPTPTPAPPTGGRVGRVGRTYVQHLQSPTETSTLPDVDVDVEQVGDPLQTGLTTLTEPPTSSALPLSPSPPHPASASTTKHATQPLPQEPTTPTPTPDAGARPTRSTLMSNTIDAVLASSNQDGGLKSHHHPALGLTMSLAALANSSKSKPPPPPFPSSSYPNPLLPSSHPLLDPPPTSQPPPPGYLMSLTLSQNAAVVVGSPEPNSGGVGVFATPGVLGTAGQGTPAATQGHGPGTNLPRRHTRAGRRGRSASPGPGLALALAPGIGGGDTPATAGVNVGLRFGTPSHGAARGLRAQSTSRPPTRTRGKLHVGEREREVTRDDLRGRVGWEKERQKTRRREERRLRACVQRVGSDRRVEVGFLEEEWDLEEGGGWFDERGQEVEESEVDEKGERRGRGRSRESGGVEERRRDKSKGKGRGKGKAPYVLVKVLGASSSSSGSNSSSSSSSSSSESDNDSDDTSDADVDTFNEIDTDPPHRRTTLRLTLPSDRSAYVDGVPSLSGSQLREACVFVASWLGPCRSSASSASGDHYAERDEGERVEEGERAQGRLEGQVGAERRAEGDRGRKKRTRVRVLAPRWRPEEAMGVVLCYLAGLGEVEGVVGDGGGKEEGPRVPVNDLVYFPPGAALPSDCHSAKHGSAKHDSTNHEFANNKSDTPTPTNLATPDVYTYSALHILAMRLLDDDRGWMGRGALYEARARLGASASVLRREDGEAEGEGEEGEKDVFGSVPVDSNAPRTPSPLTPSPAEDDAEGGGSDEDTLGSSTEDGGMEQQQQKEDGLEQPRGRTHGHAREGAEWKLALTLRSASLPAHAPAPSRSRALSLSLPRPRFQAAADSIFKLKEKSARRRAKTRERGGLGTTTCQSQRKGKDNKDEDGDEDREEEQEEEEEEEWTGFQDAWRGVLSYDGLVRLAGVLYGEEWVGQEMGVS